MFFIEFEGLGGQLEEQKLRQSAEVDKVGQQELTKSAKVDRSDSKSCQSQEKLTKDSTAVPYSSRTSRNSAGTQRTATGTRIGPGPRTV